MLFAYLQFNNPIESMAQELTSDEIKEIIVNSKKIGVGIGDVGPKKWFKDNWYFGIGTLIAVGTAISKVTKTKKDDQIVGKVRKIFQLIGKIFSFGMG
jgi:hypothetical protein